MSSFCASSIVWFCITPCAVFPISAFACTLAHCTPPSLCLFSRLGVPCPRPTCSALVFILMLATLLVVFQAAREAGAKEGESNSSKLKEFEDKVTELEVFRIDLVWL